MRMALKRHILISPKFGEVIERSCLVSSKIIQNSFGSWHLASLSTCFMICLRNFVLLV